uniref:Reverse transcriptase domain-containing protein n=1 Tax=Xenopus tropicalis TaxID=8364 RepID=A0A803K2L1_XENTR
MTAQTAQASQSSLGTDIVSPCVDDQSNDRIEYGPLAFMDLNSKLDFSDECGLHCLHSLQNESLTSAYRFGVDQRTLHDKLRVGSDFYPVHCRSSSIDRFQELIENKLLILKAETRDLYTCSNLSVDEKAALKQLREDGSLVVKNADKGGMVVVLDSTTYKDEAMRQLNDSSTYQVLLGDPTGAFTEILTTLVHGAFKCGLFTEKIRDYLIPASPQIPLFHHLPKVHKLERPPLGRPIVSCISSLNERLSEYIDIYLQPLVKRLISFVLDTKNVLQLLHSVGWEDEFSWATVDVASLYSCIPHDRGLQAISYHLDNYSTYDIVTKNFILDSINYLLTHNFFLFDGVFYLQKCGTSMGARFAPTYANLYMGWWEESHIYGGSSLYSSNIVFYKRYVDDLLFIWRGSESEFGHFLGYLNYNTLNLRFTSEFSRDSISFLDLKLTVSGSSVVTTVFRKPCSGNSLLRADSCHPFHMFKGIPLGQFYRLRRNCSTEHDFLEQAIYLRDRFLSRGYSIKSLSQAFIKALRTDRSELLANRNKGSDNRTKKSRDLPTFVTAFSNQFYKVKRILYDLIPVLYNDPDLAVVLQDGCNVVARRAPTLGNLLSPTLWKSQPRKTSWLNVKGTYRCGARRCVTCTYIKQSVSFNSTVTGRSYDMQSYANCNTRYVVYLLTCSKCGMQYVGCTTRSLKCRMREHIRHIV